MVPLPTLPRTTPPTGHYDISLDFGYHSLSARAAGETVTGDPTDTTTLTSGHAHLWTFEWLYQVPPFCPDYTNPYEQAVCDYVGGL